MEKPQTVNQAKSPSFEKDPHNPELYHYVDSSNQYMQEAYREACKSGCGSRQIGAVIVKGKKIIARGHNGRGRELAPCPRVSQNLPSGVGYQLCSHCVERNHTESDAMRNAKREGANIANAEIYIFGHWWACAPCREKVRAAGITKIYLVENAAELFKERGMLHTKSWYKKHET